MPKPNIGLEACQHFVEKLVYCLGHIVKFENLQVKSPRSLWKGNPDFSTFSRVFSCALFGAHCFSEWAVHNMQLFTYMGINFETYAGYIWAIKDAIGTQYFFRIWSMVACQ